MDVGAIGGLSSGVAERAADAARSLELGRAERARGAAGAGEEARAADMFEELLATTLVKELRRGLSDGFFGGGTGSDVYEGWLDEHVGRSLAQSHALDLAQAIRTSLSNKARTAPEGAEATR